MNKYILKIVWFISYFCSWIIAKWVVQGLKPGWMSNMESYYEAPTKSQN